MTERKTIVVVDDDRTSLTAARNALMGSYDVFTVSSGERLFSLLMKVIPDLILLDIEMPGMKGFDVIKILKASQQTCDIPVIFLSALSDTDSEIQGYDLGAVDYIFKPFTKKLLMRHAELHLLIGEQQSKLKHYASNLEDLVNAKTQTVVELQNAILKTMAELVERRDDITGGHIDRTQTYLRMLIDFLIANGIYTEELTSWDTDLFIISAQLHDVGKISIRDDILLKPGKLTYEEFEEMKKHTVYGLDVIKKIEESTAESDFLKYAEYLTISHHEKWNGTGYPKGLAGDDIPLHGRLMTIVDVYDALTNERPYKKAFSHKEAIQIIKEGLGEHFDPRVAEIFLKYEEEFSKVARGQKV